MEERTTPTSTAQPDGPASARSPFPLVLILTLSVIAASIIVVTLQGVSGVLPLAGLTLVSLLLMRVLPVRFPPIDVLAQRPQAQIRHEASPLLVYALIFPLLTIPFVLWGRSSVIAVLPVWSKGGWVFSWNFLLCKVVLLLIPTIVCVVRVRSTGAELGLHGSIGPWRWLGPLLGGSPIYLVGALLPLALFLTQKGPVAPLWVVGIVALYVLLTGAVAEEYFYRVLLQTRLERLIGRWSGIALSPVLFGLFHLPLHYATLRTAPGLQALAQFAFVLAGIFANQVVIGFFFGYMWSRYRNGWMNVALHLLYDGITTILALSGA
jgi:membrane protease YdiL (CAAX protease family)